MLHSFEIYRIENYPRVERGRVWNGDLTDSQASSLPSRNKQSTSRIIVCGCISLYSLRKVSIRSIFRDEEQQFSRALRRKLYERSIRTYVLYTAMRSRRTALQIAMGIKYFTSRLDFLSRKDKKETSRLEFVSKRQENSRLSSRLEPRFETI